MQKKRLEFGIAGSGLIVFLFCSLLILASARILKGVDGSKSPDWDLDKFTYLPSGKILKPMVLDMDEAAASLLWVKGVLYMADSYLEGRAFDQLAHMLRIVVALNPRFKPAYEFGGMALANHPAYLKSSLEILEIGIKEYPEDWRIRVYASMNRLELDSNYAEAAKYLEALSMRTDIPEHIRFLAATLMDKGGKRRLALAFMVDRYIKTSDPMSRDLFIRKIMDLVPPKPGFAMPEVQVVRRILAQAEHEKGLEAIAVALLEEYLSGTPSQNTVKILELLGR